MENIERKKNVAEAVKGGRDGDNLKFVSRSQKAIAVVSSDSVNSHSKKLRLEWLISLQVDALLTVRGVWRNTIHNSYVVPPPEIQQPGQQQSRRGDVPLCYEQPPTFLASIGEGLQIAL